MKKLLALVASLLLVASFATPAQSAGAKYKVYQKTLATFSSTATTLTGQQKAQVKAAVEANPDAEKFICTGIRYFSQPMSVNIMVRKRAKAACEYAKQLNPELSTWYQNKPTQARSYAGKVLLTVKTEKAEPTFDSFDPEDISSLAFSSVQAKLASISKDQALSYTLIAGPSVSDSAKVRENARLQNSLLFWSSVYSEPFAAYLYTGDDVDWLIGELEARGNPFWNDLVRNHYWRSTGNCSQSSAAAIPGNHHFIHCQRSTSGSLRESVIFAHELAHLPIMSFAGNQPLGIFSTFPVWMNEGGAQFFSIVLTNEANDDDSAYWHKLHLSSSRDKITLSTRPEGVNFKDLLADITVAETVELMTVLESQSALDNNTPYAMGLWATELLVAIKGIDTYFEFLQGLDSNTDWEAALEETYGFDKGDLYGYLTKYLHWIWKTYK